MHDAETTLAIIQERKKIHAGRPTRKQPSNGI
jgi:hypothetical protein